MFFTQISQGFKALWSKISKPLAVDHGTPKFLQVLKEDLEERKIKKEWSDETVRKYDFCFKKIERFFKLQGYDRLTVDRMSIPIFEGLRIWMHKPGTAKSCGLTHSSRHLETCIHAMDFAVRREYIKFNPILALETGRDKRKPVVHLSEEELVKFINYKFNNSGFFKAQVLFTFACATGISYGNLFDYQTHIDPEDGGLWIEDNRKKIGNKPFYVPLDGPGFEIAKAIHLFFDGKLPHLENGCYNRYLKEMAVILSIVKRITSHTARKTFATLMDQAGFSVTVIAAMLGNSEEICRDNYINVTKKKIFKAVQERSRQVA